MYETIEVVLIYNEDKFLSFPPGRYEAELSRWRAGETVPEKERASTRQLSVPVAEDSFTRSSGSPLPGSPLPGSLGTPIANSNTPSMSPVPFATPTPAEARAFEEERSKLYQQIDEKVTTPGRLGYYCL